MRTLIALFVLASFAVAKGPPRKEPGPKTKGKVYEWTAPNGGLYRYYVPKSYDPKKGAHLVFLLHGSNGNRGWAFANIPVGKFRPDDILVSPDGSQKRGEWAYNREPTPAEAKYLHDLHADFKERFEVKQTFLYGHSQGSYFSHYYAAAYPEEVDGYVAMASGVWNHPDFGEKGHHQAVVVMHGTQDPVVPYGAGVYAYGVLNEAKFPKLHFRSLEGWNHWPTDNNSKVPHTAQQITWCEGMTTDDPVRMEYCLKFLTGCKRKERNDYAGIYRLAGRILAHKEAPDGLKKKAEAARKGVEALAAAHVKALKPRDEFAKGAWVGHVPMFLRAFRGVPAREEFAKKWEPILTEHREAAVPHLRSYFAALRSGQAAEAFAAGVQAITNGYLHYECADLELRKNLAKWRKELKGLPRDAVKAYDAIVPDYEKSWKEAYRAFDGVQRKAKL